MTSYLQLLGAAGPDSPPSLLLFFDNSRYLINAPEGTQRFATQHQIRLSKLHHVLLTRSSNLTLGGLPGLAITLADLGVKRLTISGAEGGVAGVMRGVRLFSVRRGMELDIREMHDGERWEDERVSIRAVVMGAVTRRLHTRVDEQRRPAEAMQVDAPDGMLQPPEKRFRAEEKGSPYHSEDDLAIASSTSAASVEQSLPPPPHSSHYPVRPASPAIFEPAVTTPFLVSSPVLSFIFSLASTPGKFDPVRAKALGLKPGPLYAQLKAGQPVWLDEERRESESEQSTEQKDSAEQPGKRGRHVHPHECVGPVRAGAEVAVVDIPWRRESSRLHRWVQRLRHNSAFFSYHTKSSSPFTAPRSSSTAPHLTAIVHLCGMAVLTHPLYMEWMSLFGPRTQHVLVNHVLAVPHSIFTSSELHHRKLQTLSHSLFCCSSPLTASSRSVAGAIANVFAPSTVVGQSLMRIHLLPITGQAEFEPLSKSPSTESGTEQEWTHRMEEYMREAWEELCSTDYCNGSQPLRSALSSSLPISPSSHLPLVLPSPVDELRAALPPIDFTPDPHIIRRLALLPRSHSPHLTFLGTGSAIPSKYRNVTGIFFHPGHPVPLNTALPTTPPFTASDAGRPVETLLGGWLLDCGEGTVGQCVRKWGVAGARDVLGALRVVFISHMHADHHLGLPAVIGLYAQEERKRRAAGETARRLIVAGPRKLVAWLSVHWQHTYEEHTCETDEDAKATAEGQASSDEVKDGADEQADVVDDDLFDFIDFFANHTLTSTPHQLSPLLASLPLPFSLTVITVRHCPDAYAVALHTPASASHSSSSASLLTYKLVYSGDTLPCQLLVDGGSCATLLLHESTFEDGMEDEARDKRHCTARQAVHVAMKMQADRTILTHFSQRYPKLADVSGGGGSGGSGDNGGDAVSGWMGERCAIAFDLMSVDWCDLYWLPKLTPAFTQLLANDVDDDADEHTEAQSENGTAAHKPAAAMKEKRKGVDRLQSSSVNCSQSSVKRKNTAQSVLHSQL